RAGAGRYRAGAAGIQCLPLQQPRFGALPDDPQDLSDLLEARCLRGRASGPPARPRRVTGPRPSMTMPNLSRAVWLMLVLGIGGCSSLTGPPAGDLGLVQDAMRQVQTSYVVPVEPDKMVSGALKGMLNKLDPH